MKTIRTSFFGELRHFFNFQKGRKYFCPLIAALYLSDDNTRLLFASTAKMDDNYTFSKLTTFSFFCANNCLFRVFIYLTPIPFTLFSALFQFTFYFFIHDLCFLTNELDIA